MGTLVVVSMRFYAVLCASAFPGRREALSAPHGAGRPRAGGSRDSQPWRTGAFVSRSLQKVTHYGGARGYTAADRSAPGTEFATSKRETARFYYTRILPRVLTHAAVIRSGAAPLMTLAAEQFETA